MKPKNEEVEEPIPQLRRVIRAKHLLFKSTFRIARHYKNLKKRPTIVVITLIVISILGVIGISKDYILPVYNAIKIKYNLNQKKNVNHVIAEGFLFFKKEEYLKAEKRFEAASRFAELNDTFSLKLWEADSAARAKRHENAYNILINSYQSKDTETSKDVLNSIAKVKLLTAIKTNNLVQIKEINDNIQSGVIFNNEIDIQLLVLKLLKKNTKFNQLLISSNIEDLLKNDDPVIVELVWSKILEQSSTDDVLELLCLSKIKSVRPDEFDLNLFDISYPLTNLRLYSLRNKEHVIQKLDEKILRLEALKTPIYQKYRSTIIQFAMSLGSQSAAALYYNTEDHNFLQINRTVFTPSASYVPIAFCPTQYRNSQYLLGVYGTHSENSELHKHFPEFKYLDNLKCVIFKKNPGGFIKIKEYDIEDSPHSMQFAADGQGYYLLFKEGSGNFLYAEYISLFDLEKHVVDLSEVNTYHSNKIIVKKNNDGLLLSFDSDIMNSNEPNATSKVSQSNTCLLNKGQLISRNIKFYNPAVDLFESLNKNKLRVEQFLMGSVSMEGRIIENIAFNRAVRDFDHLYYKRSTVDDSYADSINGLQKELSALFLQYDPGEEAQTKNDFIILVRKNSSSVVILDIFELDEKGGILKSVFKAK